MKKLKIIDVKKLPSSDINFENYCHCIYFHDIQWLRHNHSWFDHGKNTLPIHGVFIDLRMHEQSDVLIFQNPFRVYSFSIRSDFLMKKYGLGIRRFTNQRDRK